MDIEIVLREYYENKFDTMLETADGQESFYDIFLEFVKPDLAEDEKEAVKKFAKDADDAETNRKKKGQSLMDFLREQQRKSSKTLSPDFKVVDKKKLAQPLLHKEEKPIPQEAKSLEQDEVNVTFDDEVPDFSREELLEMSEEKLEGIFNKDNKDE